MGNWGALGTWLALTELWALAEGTAGWGLAWETASGQRDRTQGIA